MLDEIYFSELLIAKFCHDIAGQIGSIDNAMEFINEENPIMKEKAHRLIESSSKQLIARLAFFRKAYGISLEIGESNLTQVKDLILNYLIGSKLKLDWEDQNISNFNLSVGQKFSKIILNFVIFMQNIIIYGGHIKIELFKTDDGKKVEISAIDPNWRLDKEIQDILCNEDGIDINTKNIQIYYTSQLLKSLGIKLLIEKSDKKYVKFILVHITK